MSSRRRRNLLRSLAILLALPVVLTGAAATYGYRYAGRRTDTIIVLHVSPDRAKPVLVSLPRDLRSTVKGRTSKINAAYAFGGPDLLVKTVAEATGLPIHHYAEIDFAGFLKVVDAVGGVTLCNRTDRTLDDHRARRRRQGHPQHRTSRHHAG